MVRQKKPDFIGIGVMKAATTWLWYQLQSHPQIVMPLPKEFHYFDELNTTPEQYYERFRVVPKGKMTGEITPSYLNVPHAPIIAHRMCPDARILVVLRNPVDRAFSHWKVAVWSQYKIPPSVPFIKAFEYGYPWGASWHTLQERGLYVKYLKRWYAEYSEDQIKIIWHDDIAEKPKVLLKDVYGWLGTDNNFVSPVCEKKFNENWSGRDPVFRPEDRKKVLDFYLPSIERLEKFTGKDLAHWKVI